MTTLYYYQILGQEFGPVPLVAVQELVASGQLDASDEIRLEGSQSWQTVDSIAELTPQASVDDVDDFLKNATPPQPQPPDRLSQCYCESLGQTLGPMLLSDLIELVHQDEVGGDDRVKIGDSSEWQVAKDVDELADLFKDDFELASSVNQSIPNAPSASTAISSNRKQPAASVPEKSVTSPPPPQAITSVPDVQPQRWFVKVLGNEYGPVDLPAMKSWVQQGRLAHESEIRRENDADWFRADTLDGLFDSPAQPPATSGVSVDDLFDEVMTETDREPTSKQPTAKQPTAKQAKSTSPAVDKESQPKPVTHAADKAVASDVPVSTADVLAKSVPRPPIVAKPVEPRVPFGEQFKESLRKPIVQCGLVMIVLFLMWTIAPMISGMFSPSTQETYDRLLAIHGEFMQLRSAVNPTATQSFADGVKAELESMSEQLEKAGAGVDRPMQQHLYFAASHNLLPLLKDANTEDPELEEEFALNMAIARHLLEGRTFDEAIEAAQQQHE